MQHEIAVSSEDRGEQKRVLEEASAMSRSTVAQAGDRLDFVMTPRRVLGVALAYYEDLYRPMTVFDVLREDHGKVKALLAQAQETGEEAGKTREKLLAEIKKALEIHAQFEEQFFYPRALATTDLENVIEDSLEEHAEAKLLLSKLEAMDSTAEEWLSTIEELTEAVEYHTKDEEEKIFPKAREAMDEAVAEAMGEQFLEIKEEAR